MVRSVVAGKKVIRGTGSSEGEEKKIQRNDCFGSSWDFTINSSELLSSDAESQREGKGKELYCRV